MISLDLDFESASKVDLRKCGLDVYARDPSTRVLMLAYQIDMGDGLEPSPPRVWLPHEGPMPPKLRDMLTDPKVRKVAHNASFEINLFRHTLGVPVDPSQWYCTMVMAMSLGLPGRLETLVRDALKLDRKYWKDPEGDRLMRLFSFPSSKATHETHPEEFKRYIEYCRQDVVAEARVFRVLRRYVQNMGKLFDGWVLDQKVNARGLPVDIEFIDAAKKIADKAKAEYKQTMIDKTGLANPNSTQQLLPWLTERGYPFASLAKNRVRIAVSDFGDEITDEAKEVIDLRLESNKTSIAKFDAIKRAAWRGRLRNVFQYYGAAATGRYAGRIIGQNIPRPDRFVEDYLPQARDMIAAGDLEALEVFFGKPLAVVASSIRSAVAPRPGRKLVVADLSSIETCTLAWWTRCQFWLDVIEGGKDAYKAFGSRWLGVPYDEVTSYQRFISKPATLGCFSADTEVLTERGWIQIIDVTPQDRVFDGVEFVEHGGVIDQGVKAVVNLSGVGATPDHEIMCGENEWLAAGCVAQEVTNTSRATEWAIGLFSRSSAISSEVSPHGTTDASVGTAGRNTSSTEGTLNEGRPPAASYAPAASPTETGARSTVASESRRGMSSACLTGSTRCAPGASGGHDQTPNTLAEASSVGSRRPKTSCGTPSRSKVGTTRASTRTAVTTTGTTSRATSGSFESQTTRETSARISSSSFGGTRTFSSTSTGSSAPGTGTPLRSDESCCPDSLRRKSSSNSRGAEERTYDILDAGPRSRFVIRTEAGPMVVHNCGYRMGPGRAVGEYPDVEKTGLWGYAANMGVEMSKEECKTAVRTYRDLSPEIVQAWYDLDEASMHTVSTGEPTRVGMLSFDLRPPFLRMRLPSGRYLHYCRPRIQDVLMEYEDESGELVSTWKTGLTYERLSQGSQKWVRVPQHGGRFTEQGNQAIALDLLQHGIETVERNFGPYTVGHFHDEIVCEVDENSDFGVDELIECMTDLPPWARGLPISAAGYESNFYRKD